MSRLKVHTEFTFGELNENVIQSSYLVIGEDESSLITFFANSFFASTHLSEIFSNVFKRVNNVDSFNTYVGELYQGLYNRYKDEAFVYVDTPFEPWNRQIPAINSQEVQKAFVNQIRKLLAKIDDSYPRYAKLLALYTANENNLMNKLESSVSAGGHSRFNDTPQSGGLYADDTHTTNVTESETSSTTTYDDKNIMQRLDEVRNMYKNVMEDWISQFEEFFWEVDGYEN